MLNINFGGVRAMATIREDGNGGYEPFLLTAGEPKEPTEFLVSQDKDFRMFWGESQGFVSFCAKSNEDYAGHDSEYRWSSRSSIFNTIGRQFWCVECNYKVAGKATYSGQSLTLCFSPFVATRDMV